jgi:hypothetical protein
MNQSMPTTQRVISIVVDRDLDLRLRAEAARQGKSLSRFAREALEGRVRAAVQPAGGCSALLKLCALAHGELLVPDLDRELYEH